MCKEKAVNTHIGDGDAWREFIEGCTVQGVRNLHNVFIKVYSPSNVTFLVRTTLSKIVFKADTLEFKWSSAFGLEL